MKNLYVDHALKKLFMIWLVIVILAAMHTVSHAEVSEREFITDTVNVDGEDKYTISYYNKEYFDGSRLYTYDLTVKCGERILANILNYSVTETPDWRYEDNGESREIKVTIKGIGDYEDLEYSFTYTFVPCKFDDSFQLKMDRKATQPELIYTGEEIRPAVYVETGKWNSNTGDFSLSTDYYTVSYENNINAGTAKVIAKGIGVYTGTLELTFEIAPCLIDYYEVLSYLRGESDEPTSLLAKEEYTLEITDAEGQLAQMRLADSVKGNYCFRAYSKLDRTAFYCTGIHIEKYLDEYAYDVCPDAEMKAEDGSFVKVCGTHSPKISRNEIFAGCENDGSLALYKCQVCGRYFTDEAGKNEITSFGVAVIPATGHAWGAWKMEVEPTTAYEGQMVSECANCHSYKYLSLPKLENDGSGNSSYNGGGVSNVSEGGSGGNSGGDMENASDGSDKTDSSGNKNGNNGESGNGTDESGEDSSNNSRVVVPTLSKVTGIKLTSKKKRQLTLTWKKLSNADGYVIQYGTDKKFKKAVTKKVSKSKKSYTIKKLKSGKKYYVRIRAYKKYKDENGKTCLAYGKYVAKNKKCK